ncbi:MAG: hypothetical protein IKN04_06970 [Clostridia bacterium]|nr:hypothetical protein [Clostridia bacterium]
MRFARSVMRPAGAVLLILVIAFMFQCAGLSEDSDPVSVTIQVTPDSLTGPGEVNVSLRVSNPGSTDMIAPVTLYDPEGSVVPSFGDGGSYILKSGDSRSWEGKWNVTQAQLDAGAVAYTLRYHVEDASGALVELNKKATARISFVGEKVNLNVNRTISPQVVRSGGQASVTYELYNNGNVELTDIRVQENISKSAKTVKSLPAGDRASVQFTSRIGNADLTSNATITYKAAGSAKTEKITVEDAVIPLAKPDLKIELSSPTTGVNVGEAATLVITFTNAGNITYSNVTVTEAKRGEILTNLTIPAGATVTEQKDFILMEPTAFKVTATLPDNTGETKTMTSKELNIGVFDPQKQLLLTLNLTSDQETVPSTPADVKFHLTVTNNSNIKAEKIAITHGNTAIYTIASLEPGGSMVLDRDVRISQAGQFRFTASLKDTMNNTVSFDSNTIRIALDRSTPAPTAAPAPTVAPPAFVTAAPVDPIVEQGRSALMTAAMALGALFAAALVLFIVSTVIRLRKRSKSKSAYDHLDLAERRDYTEPADYEFDEEAEEETAEQAETDLETAAPVVLPHERVLNQAEAERNGMPDSQDIPNTDDEGGYRVSRSIIQEETDSAAVKEPEAETASPEESVNAAAEGRRRHRRSARREDDE